MPKNLKIIISLAFLLVVIGSSYLFYISDKAKKLGFKGYSQMFEIQKQGYETFSDFQNRYIAGGFDSLEEMKEYNSIGIYKKSDLEKSGFTFDEYAVYDKYYWLRNKGIKTKDDFIKVTGFEDALKLKFFYSNFFISSKQQLLEALSFKPIDWVKDCDFKWEQKGCDDKTILWIGKKHPEYKNWVIFLNHDGTTSGLKKGSEYAVMQMRYGIFPEDKEYGVFMSTSMEDVFWGADKFSVLDSYYSNDLEEILGYFEGFEEISIKSQINTLDPYEMAKFELEKLDKSDLIKLYETTLTTNISVSQFNEAIVNSFVCRKDGKKIEFFILNSNLEDKHLATAYSDGIFKSNEGSIIFTETEFNDQFIFDGRKLNETFIFNENADSYEFLGVQPINSNFLYPMKADYYVSREGKGYAFDVGDALRNNNMLRYDGTCEKTNNQGERFLELWLDFKNSMVNEAISMTPDNQLL